MPAVLRGLFRVQILAPAQVRRPNGVPDRASRLGACVLAYALTAGPCSQAAAPPYRR